MVRGKDSFVVGDGVQADVGCNVDSGVVEVVFDSVKVVHYLLVVQKF